MDTFSLKFEPELEQLAEHDHKLPEDNFKGEQLDKFNQKCINKEFELQSPPTTSKKSDTNKNRIQNNVINKSPGKKKNKYLTTFLRNKFLKVFMDNDCTSRCLDKCVKKYEADKETIIEHFDKAAQDAQAFVHQECESLCFSNITEWLKHFQKLDVQKDNNFESAIIMNAIVNNESHPDAESTGGVNLKSIYKFISNSLMGLPQKPLDPVSGNFLSCEFQNLINEANTDEADNDVRTMKIRIETALSEIADQPSSSLDPLKFTDSDELLSLIQNTITNKKDCNIVKIEK